MQRKLLSNSKALVREFAPVKQYKIAPTTMQSRGLQSTKKTAPGFFDSLGGTDTQEYTLDVHPYEWRDEQLKYYTTNHVGMIILMFVSAFPLLLALWVWGYYSCFDSAITFLDRTNIHPNLRIQSGADNHKDRNPLFHLVNRWGMTQITARTLFYHEIEAALAEKAKNKK